MAIGNIAARYLSSLEETDTTATTTTTTTTSNVLQPSNRLNSPTKFNRKSLDNNSQDLDALARALNITPSKPETPTSISKGSATSLLRTKFESPSATVSSFKSTSSSNGVSPTKKNHFVEITSDETPSWANKNYKDILNKSPTKFNTQSNVHTPLKQLNQPIGTPSSSSSSPAKNASKSSPGYEYLCRIEAIKQWLELVLQEQITQSASQLISYIRNGIHLAKLANVVLPTSKPVFLNDSKLQFKHTENINRFFQLLDFFNMPDLFRFELTDLYDAKNVPKVWFCLHALSYILHKQDPSYPVMNNLVGKVDFSADDIRTANRALVNSPLPNFSSADTGEGKSDTSNNNSSTTSATAAFMDKVTSPVKKTPSPLKRPQQLQKKQLELVEDNKPELTQDSSGLSKISRDDPFTDRVDLAPPSTSNAKLELHTPPSKSLEFKIKSPIIDLSHRDSDYYTPELESHLPNIIKFQSLARGAVFRYLMFVDRILLKSYQDEFTNLFAIIRGNKAPRKTVHKHRDELRLYSFEIIELQSIIRKNFVINKKPNFTSITNDVETVELQSLIRGKLTRDWKKYITNGLEKFTPQINDFQSLVRMKSIYSKSNKVISHKDEILPSLIELQSIARSQLYHRFSRSNAIDETEIIKIQSIIRRNAVIEDLYTKLSKVRSNKRRLIELQSIARGGVARTKLCNSVLVTLIYEDGILNQLFAKIRGDNYRKKFNSQKSELLKYEKSSIIPVQTLFRGVLSRYTKEVTLSDIFDQIDSVITLQSVARGKLMRGSIYEFSDYYQKHIKQVVKAQAILQRVFAQNAYKQLITSKNPPLKVIRRFAPLLSNNDRDFQDEMTLSDLKDLIIEKCKANEEYENQIEQLDMKLGLLDKNKISIEEFLKPTKGKTFKPIVENVKNLERLNKSLKKKIELWQTLFYFIQTNPIYLTKLFNSIPYTKNQTKSGQDLFQSVIQLFPVRDSSITYHSREEYFLVKLMIQLMQNDTANSNNLGDITKLHLTNWIDFFTNFNNHTFQRQHLKALLGKFVIRIVDNEQVDFESDPIRIYNQIIDHEMKVYGRSEKSRDISPQAAIQLPEVSNKFVGNLMSLRETCSDLLSMLQKNASGNKALLQIPDHVKLICRQGYLCAQRKFPNKSDQQHLAVAGVIFVKHYLGSILQVPENYGILTGNNDTQKAKSKDNLRYLYRVMLQLFSMKPFNDNFLKPLNEYIMASTDTVKSIISQAIIDVGEIETVYELHDYDDLVTHQRPKLTISVNSLIQLEKSILQNVDIITTGNDDQLYKTCVEVEKLLISPQDMLTLTDLSSVTLNLNPTTQEESIVDSKTKTLFTQAKRCLLYIIRVQEEDDSDDLLELLISGIKPSHEQRFKEIVQYEKAEQDISLNNSKSVTANTVNKKKSTRPYSGTSLGDLSNLTYHELKKMCLEIILKLESMGELTRKNSFQTLLNQIAMDIKTKDSQRQCRWQQLQVSQKTIKKLSEKENYLKTQLHNYNKHVESVLLELQSKSKSNDKNWKRRLFNIMVIPVFSKQYFYHRELRKHNRLPKFGSYKYSAKKLIDQKVLIDFSTANNVATASKLDFMFSCHQVGKFTIEVASGTVNIPGATNTITLDELLALQYENKTKFELFDGMATFDSNNFMGLIFRKFYDLKKE
ncbi:IQ motif containing GTPase activating protein 1 [Candida albicans]